MSYGVDRASPRGIAIRTYESSEGCLFATTWDNRVTMTAARHRTIPTIRVLHVLGSLDRGGIEAWLVHTVRHIDRSLYQMGVALHSQSRGALERTVEDFRVPIFRLPPPSPSAWKTYRERFGQVLEEFNPSVVHSHVHHYSGRVLQLAKRLEIPGRIAHGHANQSTVQNRLPRKSYLFLMRRWIHKYATAGLAASPEAAADLFGRNWHLDSRWTVLPSGIDLSQFDSRSNAITDATHRLRSQLGLAQGQPVIGHVGRFVAEKNHRMVIDIAQETLTKLPDAVFLLIGWGPLRDEVEADIKRRGLQDRCWILGERDDVPQLMLHVLDALVLPSLHEGMSMSLLEAQAAGIPSIVSDRVSRTAEIVPGLVHFVPLTSSSSEWCSVLSKAIARGRLISRGSALAIMEDSPANIRICVKRLQQLYERAIPQESQIIA
jgi:glycosyltransferase involved in cell wall biosynthesis